MIKESKARGIILAELGHGAAKEKILTKVKDKLHNSMEKAIEYWNLFAGNPS